MLPLVEPTWALSYSVLWWLLPIIFTISLIAYFAYRILTRHKKTVNQPLPEPKLNSKQLRQKYLTQIAEIEKFSLTIKAPEYRQVYLLLSATIRNYVDEVSAQHSIAMTAPEFKRLGLTPAESIVLLCSEYSFNLKLSSQKQLTDQINLARSFVSSWG